MKVTGSAPRCRCFGLRFRGRDFGLRVGVSGQSVDVAVACWSLPLGVAVAADDGHSCCC